MMGLGSGAGWMWLFWLLLVVGLALVVVVAVRVMGGGLARGGGGDAGRRPQPGARQVLDERYARGELGTEEYRERLKVLGEET